MSSDDFEIEGLDALLENLNRLPKTFGEFALEDAGRYALIPFLMTVRGLAPTDNPTETPKRAPYTLRDSYIISTRLNERQTRLNKKPNYVEVHAGTNDPVGTWREFGHFIAARKQQFGTSSAPGMSLTWVPPQPHVGPAWQATRPEVLKRAASEMARNLDLAVRAMKT